MRLIKITASQLKAQYESEQWYRGYPLEHWIEQNGGCLLADIDIYQGWYLNEHRVYALVSNKFNKGISHSFKVTLNRRRCTMVPYLRRESG